MTLEEKAGQMTQPESARSRISADIQRLCLGSVLSGGSSDPKTVMSDRMGAAFTRVPDASAEKPLAIPILYGIDALHGHNNVLGAVIFPHNIGLGCTRNPALGSKKLRA